MANSEKKALHGANETILIAEDNIVIQHLLAGLLERNGFIILGPVATGLEAIKQYMDHKPSLVLMDIYMPVLDGLQATKYLLETDADAKIVMISTDADKELVYKAMNAGAKDYIVKPINTARLLGIISELLNPALNPK